MSDPPIRVLLADDHVIVREGLRALLTATSDIEVVGEAADGRATVEAARLLHPDVVVMDINMPSVNGIDATRELCQGPNPPKIVILSMFDGEAYVRPAVRAGADAYLVKGSGLSDLVAAIRAVHRGGAFFSPTVAKHLLPEPASQPSIVLTPRQREVLALIGTGKSGPEIAKILGVSAKSIEGQRARIMSKLRIHKVAGLVLEAIRLGLVDPRA